MKSIVLLIALLLTGCNSMSTARYLNGDYPSLGNELEVGRSPLIPDTVELPRYPALTAEQRSDLARQSGLAVPDSTQIIGVRAIDDKCVLAAYKVILEADPNQFKVYLVTHRNDGAAIDALDLGEFHTSEHQGPMRLGGNRFYTTDATVTFDDSGRHFTQHRVMTLTSIYLKTHRLTEAWRVEWDNDYDITADGHFAFKGQHETTRTPAEIDDPVIDDYKSRDLPRDKKAHDD